jgi:hypothetical protein
MSKVNLDAIVPREDFEVIGNNSPGVVGDTISISDLTSGYVYPFIRKPDFQRETSEWDAKQIGDFLESFLNGDLIPSIILWRSASGNYFVIDGAHRLGVLVAWIYDDYGDKDISQKFYDHEISQDEIEVADKARRLINHRIGSFLDIKNSPIETNPNPAYLQRAKNMGAYKLRVQWVEGNAEKAENSFFKINQQGVPLNKTEIKLLESRKKANCIAARAIWKAGRGHKFWIDFSAENQKEIQRLAGEINKILFMPPLKTPVKNLHLPIAGRMSVSLPLIFDFINIVNNVPSDFKENLLNDDNGNQTIQYLREVRKIAWRINSEHPSSLGLDSIVYFYNTKGQHKATSFRAVIVWMLEMQKNNTFKEFIRVRANFEELLLKYNDMIQDIGRKLRQSVDSYYEIKDFYVECIKALSRRNDIDEAIKEVIRTTKFNYLKMEMHASNSASEITSATIKRERKSSVFIKEALETRIRCKICGARLHENSIESDHIIREEDGGLGGEENIQLTHPFCNSTVKN